MAEFGELFRSADEQLTPIQAKVKGSIPTWLRGSLVRLGPGKFDLGNDFVMNHWLDGYAILYKFEIADGKVKFSSQFLHSDAYEKAVRVGRPVITEFGTRSYPDPCKNIFSRMMSSLAPELTDNDAINIFTLQDSVYVASETNYLHRIDPKTLDTCEKVDLHKVVGINSASSHACTDANNDTYNIGSTFITGLKYHIFKIPASQSKTAKESLEKSSIVATIPSSWTMLLSYYHSFGLSDNYIVLIEQPLTFNGLRLLAMLVKGKSLNDCLEWKPQEKNTFHIVSKITGKALPLKYKSEEAFFVFHHINTYEEDGQLIVDVMAYDSPEIIDKLYLKDLRNSKFSVEHPAGGRRFVLPLSTPNANLPENVNLVRGEHKASAVRHGDTIHLKPQLLSPQVGYELPTINHAFFAKKYRYFYACGMYDPTAFRNAVVKVDTLTGKTLVWRESDYSFPGEAQFVPKPGTNEEDDGILLCAATDVRIGFPDFLLILDARTMTEIARAEVTVNVPNLVHGVFLK